MHQLFNFLSIFDWITPSVGLIQDMINDPSPLQSNSWTFFIPYQEAVGSGWNAFDIEDLMKRHYVHTWGSQITNGEFFFSVKLDQAQQAEYWLSYAGVPMDGRSLGAPEAKPTKSFVDAKPFGKIKITKTRNIFQRIFKL